MDKTGPSLENDGFRMVLVSLRGPACLKAFPQPVFNVLTFVIIPAIGLSMATSTLVGQNTGAGQIERAAAIARLSALVAFGSLTALGLVTFAFAFSIVRFFVPGDGTVILAGVRLSGSCHSHSASWDSHYR